MTYSEYAMTLVDSNSNTLRKPHPIPTVRIEHPTPLFETGRNVALSKPSHTQFEAVVVVVGSFTLLAKYALLRLHLHMGQKDYSPLWVTVTVPQLVNIYRAGSALPLSLITQQLSNNNLCILNLRLQSIVFWSFTSLGPTCYTL